MQFRRNIPSGGSWPQRFGTPIAGFAPATVALLLISVTGCASPGPPLPPSLKLPQVVADLTATRVGDQVRLRWTTPARTTDKLKIMGQITAELCRETPTAAAPPATASAPAQRQPAPAPSCSPVVAHLAVQPGASETTDTLPAALAAAPVSLLAYRVQLLSASGHTAGPSAAVFVASGPAPPPVEGLRASASKAGAVLEWAPEAGDLDAVELDRITAEAQPSAGAVASAEPKSAPARAPKPPPESHLRVAGQADPGGAIDRTVITGESYRYTAQRVRTVVLDGRSLEVRSAPSASVPVVMADVFPPNTPVGLVASPGFAGEANGPPAQAAKPAIDLSWEPGIEPRIAGYRVYRRQSDGAAPNTWRRLNSELSPTPAYRDLTVDPGRRYAYRVTAVDAAGNESQPSNEVVETAPAQ